MEILGYICAALIGVSLGLLGGGGSILTVPVLVYLFKIDPVTATAYSLFIVGLTSLIGSFSYFKKEQLDFIIGTVFAIPAFSTVYLTRKFVIPAIPEVIFSVEQFQFTKDIFIMVFFAVLMFTAALSMIRKRKLIESNAEKKMNYVLLIFEGVVVGFLTGLVGAGGGFVIVPALVLLAKLPMKTAVGTSLLIIALKSLIGFMGDISAQLSIDWELLIIISVIAVVGIYIGSYISNFISGAKLKPAFGWFVLAMSILIIGKEVAVII